MLYALNYGIYALLIKRNSTFVKRSIYERDYQSGKLVSVPFSKIECGVDFYINTGKSVDISGVLTEYKRFRTDFFCFFFFRKANGFLLLNFRRIDLRDDMILLLSPHQKQEWHVDEATLDYTFLIFREDFMRTFIADKFFVYRLLYCYQTDTPPYLYCSPGEQAEYIRLLGKIKQELLHPVADSYNLIVSVLYYLLVIINRAYATAYQLPVEVPKTIMRFSIRIYSNNTYIRYNVFRNMLICFTSAVYH